MNGEIIYTDQNMSCNQAVNMFISAVKFHILTWGSMGIDSLLRPGQVAIRGTAVFGTSLLCSLLSMGVCPLGKTPRLSQVWAETKAIELRTLQLRQT